MRARVAAKKRQLSRGSGGYFFDTIPAKSDDYNRKVRDIVRLIEEDGWRFHSQRGSHRQYVHASKRGRVTVPGKPGADLTMTLRKSILKQAQIEKEQA